MFEFELTLWDALDHECKKVTVKADSLTEATAQCNLEGARYTLANFSQKKAKQRGGKREGSGRKNEGKASKVVRVPVGADIEKLLQLGEDLKSLIEAWKKEIHPTSPRDEMGRTMIEELENLL